ncbi:MAG: NAD(P)H-dependent oxidoreductase [Firmicutes bacterium]|nr:NAD(P)H-dependent oxidoreductase [Bacillota bacterium]
MNILVINGSPKGEYSITLQTVKFLEKKFPDHQFNVIHAGQKIKALERDFVPVIEAVTNADLILYSYPVYTFIVPYQLHRFIELVKESGVDLAGKFVTQLSTSKHFYDVTAHRFIQDNCQDLEMKYIRGLSADMEDLLTDKGQREAIAFMDRVLWSVNEDHYEPFSQRPSPPNHKVVFPPFEMLVCEVQESDISADRPGDVVILTDCEPDNIQLKSMIDQFRYQFPRKTRVVNLREYPFRGGCLGCFHCAADGKCVYTDGFDEYLRSEIQTAEAIVIAFTIKDHSMGSTFKLYDDRQFCNGHRTVTMGMPMGYLVSGNYSQEPNLRTIIEARAEVGNNFLAGVATDEVRPEWEITELAKSLNYAIEQHYGPPQNFYGVGGMKIFRDLIYQMQGMMKADHKFYKSHGQYDFPQKKKGTILKMYLVGLLISNPKIKAKMGNAMNEGMIAPYKKLIDSIK